MVNINSAIPPRCRIQILRRGAMTRILTAMNINDVAISEIVPYQPVSYLLRSANPAPIIPSRFLKPQMEWTPALSSFGSHMPDRKANAGHGLDQRLQTLAQA
jgi:hypothetical protein